MSLKSHIRACAFDLGFDAVGIASPFVGEYLEEYRQWIAHQTYEDMQYLKNHLPFKENPNLLLDGVKSAIVVAKNYKNTDKKQLEGSSKIARYAVGRDYHLVMEEALTKLSGKIKEWQPDWQCYIGVDSKPIAERTLAIMAGIGFRGRNTLIIRPRLGSYFFLGVLLTTGELPVDQPFIGTCGTCMRCVDACPTQALTPEGTLEVSKCIAYQTVEKKTLPTIDTDGWMFGCDVCQEVCPFNHDNIPMTHWESLMPQSGIGFDFFDRDVHIEDIPKDSAMYRSRKRVMERLLSKI